MFWQRQSDDMERYRLDISGAVPVGNVLVNHPAGEDVLVLRIWESLQAIQKMLQKLTYADGPSARRYAIFMTIHEQAMAYYYYFIFRAWERE